MHREFKNICKKVSGAGYGAMSLGDFYGPIDHQGCLAVLAACYDLGVDHLNTAGLYAGGDSERVIGEHLRASRCP